MHEQLGDPKKQLACSELISALEACHAQGMLYRMTGACNDEKHALKLCLRQERIDRTTRNREASKDRNAKKYDAWKRLREEGLETPVPVASAPPPEKEV